VQYVWNLLNISSITVQTFNTVPTLSIVTAQIRYCEINIARVGVSLH
jgi:hypothetical protein